MAKAVLIQNPESIYDDVPGVRYHFPKMYLATLEAAVGDWVVFYEGKRGVLGYTAVQRVREIRPDPGRDDHFYAELELGTLWEFEQVVDRCDPRGRPYESMLRRPDGTPLRGGANTLGVRRLPEAEFARIVSAGLAALDGPEALPREAPPPGLADAPAAFEHASLSAFRPELLTSRKARDASFARMVKHAYGARCAISGLELRNGLGRAEVQAAHIRPVQHQGPDTVRNGLALSGTLHWMFDRGLISVAEDHRILVSHNKVSPEIAGRLIAPERRLFLPENPRHHPHPEFLRYHREVIFGSG